VRASGERIKVKGKEGDSLLDVVVNNNIDLDGFGACEGTLTCSTCHLIFSKPDFEKLPDKPGDEELDMLDLAYDLTDTSRLGCQIYLSKDMNGLEVKVNTPKVSLSNVADRHSTGSRDHQRCAIVKVSSISLYDGARLA
jgi:ferredoxin-1, mitochondrial